jgi:hypothetical protein
MELRMRDLSVKRTLCSIAVAAISCLSASAMQPVSGQAQPVAFVAASNPQLEAASSAPAQPDAPTAKPVMLTGTIVKNANGFALRDEGGALYQLDAQETAKPFEGKSVKVTGKLDESAKLIYVDSIEAAAV